MKTKKSIGRLCEDAIVVHAKKTKIFIIILMHDTNQPFLFRHCRRRESLVLNLFLKRQFIDFQSILHLHMKSEDPQRNKLNEEESLSNVHYRILKLVLILNSHNSKIHCFISRPVFQFFLFQNYWPTLFCLILFFFFFSLSLFYSYSAISWCRVQTIL